MSAPSPRRRPPRESKGKGAAEEASTRYAAALPARPSRPLKLSAPPLETRAGGGATEEEEEEEEEEEKRLRRAWPPPPRAHLRLLPCFRT